ncbi:hypothetical protein [Vibrio phage vB_VmeM-Yong XC32]|nr:hypothetical protein [Vibrio phage vB_VmeM-Yong XC31]QAX96506.1 hypothetical protein [Vibrio phage vB_VmeM-Yong XC32]QAX96823.1 hypothetical protein [Vibrio phage vB_VmeM-Yong MS31]QAX97142.1 hypothetical protein [Vibrio phage vB_VmeM-Yong MS32]
MASINPAFVKENLATLEKMAQSHLRTGAATISPGGKVKLEVKKVTKLPAKEAGTQWLVESRTDKGHLREWVIDAHNAADFVLQFNVEMTYKQSTRNPDTFAVHAWVG